MGFQKDSIITVQLLINYHYWCLCGGEDICDVAIIELKEEKWYNPILNGKTCKILSVWLSKERPQHKSTDAQKYILKAYCLEIVSPEKHVIDPRN
ncbi:hypothetical protein LXL04_028663 [Taraxacum kok-saghyz]